MQRLKILCLSLCLSPVSVCMRLGFQQIQIRSLWLQTTSVPAKMMDGLQFTCTGTGITAQVSSMIYWYHCRSFIHSLSLPLFVFMLPYVFYNCFYETTHNIYRQKISWPTNEQLQHLSCRRLLTHTDTANSRAASITHGDLLLQTETIPPLPAVYFHIEPSPVSVTRHQPCVTIGPGVGSISRRGHEHARSSCAALCDQFDESSIFTTCKAFHE